MDVATVKLSRPLPIAISHVRRTWVRSPSHSVLNETSLLVPDVLSRSHMRSFVVPPDARNAYAAGTRTGGRLRRSLSYPITL